MDSKKQWIGALFLTIALCLCMCLTVFASEDSELDLTETGSITLDYLYNSLPLDDVSFQVYHIATYLDEQTIDNNENFEDFSIEYLELSDETYWLSACDGLQTYIEENEIASDQVFATDDCGCCSLNNLELGLYYIEADEAVIDDTIYFSKPILIFVGQYDDQEDQWVYEFDITPKISVMSEVLEDPVDPEEPEEPEEPEDEPELDEEIPQTGSFAYQIPIIAGMGLVLMLCGFVLQWMGAPHENKK